MVWDECASQCWDTLQEAASEHRALLLHPSELQEDNFVCVTAALLVTLATPAMRHEAKRC